MLKATIKFGQQRSGQLIGLAKVCCAQLPIRLKGQHTLIEQSMGLDHALKYGYATYTYVNNSKITLHRFYSALIFL